LSRSIEGSDTQQALAVLKEWLKGAPPSLILAFRTWFRRVKLPRHLPGVVLPELIDLQEVENMLATADDWLEQSKEEGRKEVLIRLLEKKFGKLEAKTRASIFNLDTDALLKCADRLLTARTLQEVIKE